MVKTCFPFMLFAIFILTLMTTGSANDKVPLLETPISPSTSVKSAPLSEALSTLGQNMEGGFVLFGLEVRLNDGIEPTVTIEGRAGMKLGDAIDQVLNQLPDYEMEVVSDHLIDLRPLGARKDTQNLLNLRIAKFDLESKRADMVFNAPRAVIPELNEALLPKVKPGEQMIFLIYRGYQGGPEITLHLTDVTIREILNAASKATEPFFEQGQPGKAPSGWMYTFDPNPPKEHSQHSWRKLFGLPTGWRVVPKNEKQPGRE
jgi:hypothetical protein